MADLNYADRAAIRGLDTLDNMSQEQISASMDALVEHAEAYADQFSMMPQTGSGVMTRTVGESLQDYAKGKIEDAATNQLGSGGPMVVPQGLPGSEDDKGDGNTVAGQVAGKARNAASDAVTSGVERMENTALDKLAEKGVDEAFDGKRTGEELSDFVEDLTDKYSNVEGAAKIGKAAMGMAGKIHGVTEAVAKYTNVIGANEVNPNISDQVAAHSYNRFLGETLGVPEDGMKASKELFGGNQDDLFNVMMNHAERIEDPTLRGRHYDRMQDLAERHHGSNQNTAPEMRKSFMAIEDEYPDASSAEKFDVLVEITKENGTYAPYGNGQLFYDSDGIPARSVLADAADETAEKNSARATELAEMDPVLRAAHEAGADHTGHYVRLDMDGMREQVSRGWSELEADANAGGAFADPRMRAGIDATIDECEAKGADGIDVLYTPDSSLYSRTVSTVVKVHGLGTELDCDATLRLNRDTDTVMREHGLDDAANEAATDVTVEIAPGPFPGTGQDHSHGYDQGMQADDNLGPDI